MCGISGVISLKSPLNEKHIEDSRKASEKLNHRGPDYCGSWKNENVVVHHNKLSILDFSSNSNQPIQVGNIIVAFNGEIYNYLDLQQKHNLSADKVFSDAYIIALGFQKFGTNFFQELEGDFSIFVYDCLKQKTYLVRDRLGVKQLTYHYRNNILYFASETKALFSHRDIISSPNINRLTSDMVMSFWSDKNDTYYDKIHHIPPGHYIECDIDGVKLRQYWSLIPSLQKNKQHYQSQKLDDLLQKATEQRLIGEARIGTLLSGGIDSSILTSMVAERSNTPFNAYTIVYDEGEENIDYSYAKEVAQKYSIINHVPNIIKKGSLDIKKIDFITHHMEEVVWDKVYWSMYSNYKRASNDNLRVIINGQGSDEVWLGYYYDFPHYSFSSEELNQKNLLEHFFNKNFYEKDYISSRYKKTIQDNIYECIDQNFEQYRKHSDDLNAIAAWATKTYLQSNLMQEDRMSMASSVECRVPFTDHHFVEAAFSISGTVKVKNNIEKSPIKEIGSKYLPKSICQRRKMAFVNPSVKYDDFAINYIFENKDKIYKSDVMREIFSNKLFSDIEKKRKFRDVNLPWKIFAIHRFLEINKFN